MDKARLQVLLAKATVDCYSDEEGFWGVFYTLESNLWG